MSKIQQLRQHTIRHDDLKMVGAIEALSIRIKRIDHLTNSIAQATFRAYTERHVVPEVKYHLVENDSKMFKMLSSRDLTGAEAV